MTTDNKYAPNVWGVEQLRDLEVPSGQLCQVRPPGMQVLIAAGVLESADTLTSLIDEKHLQRVAPPRSNGRAPTKATAAKAAATPIAQVDTMSLMKDPDNLRKIFTLVDRVAVHMVVQPGLLPNPAPGEPREEGVIYVDMVDFLDKMYIFQYAVGGSTELEQFRKQFAESMGGVAVS